MVGGQQCIYQLSPPQSHPNQWLVLSTYSYPLAHNNGIITELLCRRGLGAAISLDKEAQGTSLNLCQHGTHTLCLQTVVMLGGWESQEGLMELLMWVVGTYIQRTGYFHQMKERRVGTDPQYEGLFFRLSFSTNPTLPSRLCQGFDLTVSSGAGILFQSHGPQAMTATTRFSSSFLRGPRGCWSSLCKPSLCPPEYRPFLAALTVGPPNLAKSPDDLYLTTGILHSYLGAETRAPGIQTLLL